MVEQGKDFSIVIVAGGKGTRMGAALPKQFLELHGKPVLYYTLLAFTQALPQAQIILVLPADQLSYAQMALQHFADGLEVQLTMGGATRFHSVQNGVQAAQRKYVMVHDGVRCLVSKKLIQRCAQDVMQHQSSIPVVPVSDSIRKKTNEGSEAVSRANLFAVQTPQCFITQDLRAAMNTPYDDSFTDEATLMEQNGLQVFLTEGEASNIKITCPEDLIIAVAFLQEI